MLPLFDTDFCRIFAEKGLRGREKRDMMNKTEDGLEPVFRAAFAGLPEPILLDQTESTNSVAKRLARQDAPAGTAVLARRQSAGRGRLGKSFFSPEGGLYLSVIVRPELPPEELPMLTMLAAVTVCEVLETRCGVFPEIKWVNDLLLHGKKLCGILCEGAGRGIVIGIGLNYRLPKGGFPGALSETACALEAQRQPPLPDLAADITRRLWQQSRSFSKASVLRRYRERCRLPGREITVIPVSEEPYRARALEITEDGALAVETSCGRKLLLQSGEISVR